MTTIAKVKRRCALCNSENEFIEIASTNEFGSSDLDTRPPEMMRSTISTWVQRCPNCGYCAGDISKAQRGAKTVVHDMECLNQLNDKSYPKLANSFLCKALIDQKAGEHARATWSLIHAAWVCDDTNRPAEAVVCRSAAADMLVKTEDHGQQVTNQNGASIALFVDLLRRSGQIEEARRVITEHRNEISEDIIIHILDFQSILMEKADLSCHTIAEALGEKNEG